VLIGIKNTAMKVPTLQLHLLSNLKVLQSKQQDLLARGIARTQHPDSTPLFPIADGNNSLKKHRGLLETLLLKEIMLGTKLKSLSTYKHIW
jgi:hypothetical protein